MKRQRDILRHFFSFLTLSRTSADVHRKFIRVYGKVTGSSGNDRITGRKAAMNPPL